MSEEKNHEDSFINLIKAGYCLVGIIKQSEGTCNSKEISLDDLFTKKEEELSLSYLIESSHYIVEVIKHYFFDRGNDLEKDKERVNELILICNKYCEKTKEYEGNIFLPDISNYYTVFSKLSKRLRDEGLEVIGEYIPGYKTKKDIMSEQVENQLLDLFEKIKANFK